MYIVLYNCLSFSHTNREIYTRTAPGFVYLASIVFAYLAVFEISSIESQFKFTKYWAIDESLTRRWKIHTNLWTDWNFENFAIFKNLNASARGTSPLVTAKFHPFLRVSCRIWDIVNWKFWQFKYRTSRARYIAKHDGLRSIVCSYWRRCDAPEKEYTIF